MLRTLGRLLRGLYGPFDVDGREGPPWTATTSNHAFAAAPANPSFGTFRPTVRRPGRARTAALE